MSRHSEGNKKPISHVHAFQCPQNENNHLKKDTNTGLFSAFQTEEHAAVQIHRQRLIVTPNL